MRCKASSRSQLSLTACADTRSTHPSIDSAAITYCVDSVSSVIFSEHFELTRITDLCEASSSEASAKAAALSARHCSGMAVVSGE